MRKLVFAIALILLACQEQPTSASQPSNLSFVDDLDMGNDHHTCELPSAQG
jgi:hypothetical protein